MAGRFSIEAIFKASDSMSRVVSSMEGRVSRFATNVGGSLKGMDKVTSRIAGGLADVTKKAAMASVAVGALVGTAAFEVGKTGADFEQAMANVGAVSLMTRAEVKDLEVAALQLGTSTKYTATQVAGGMELMGKAGFENAQVLQGIGPILSAAAAEGAEFEEVAGHVSNMLKGMGLETTEAGRVADVLTLASARTNSSISSLGESMANVSSTARQFKIPLEQAVASVALLQDVGLDASVAGSAVNTMLTQMAAPSKKAQEQMTALGISFQDAKGDMLPLTDIFAQFAKASKKSGGNMKQVAFFAELVGLRGQKAAGNLEKLFTEGKFGKLVDELNAAEGSAKKMADLRMNTLTGDLTLLSNVADTVKIKLFDMSSGPLRSLVQGTREWLVANQDLIKSEFVKFLENAKFAIDIFAAGFREGFGVSSAALLTFLKPFGMLIEKMNGIQTWPKDVKNLGQAFGFLVPVAAGFMIFAGAVKVARVALVLYAAAAKIAAFAAFEGQGALVAYRIAMEGVTLRSVAQKVAEYAGAAATWAKTAATRVATIATTAHSWAEVRNALAVARGTVVTTLSNAATWLKVTAQRAVALTVGLAATAANWYAAASVRGTVADGAATVATWLKNTAVAAVTLATNLYAIARGRATIAEIAGTTATAAANLTMGAFLITVTAAAAAIASMYLVYKKFVELLDVSGGWEGLKAGLGTLAEGKGLFAGIDAYQNEQAKRDSEQRGGAPAPQVSSPTEAISSSVETSTTSTGEVTVRAAPGTSAAVSKAPSGFGLRVAPSGSP